MLTRYKKEGQSLNMEPEKVDMKQELKLTTYHLRAFLKSHLRLVKAGTPSAAVSRALLVHLHKLKPADIGLPGDWEEHKARIEALAAVEAESEGLAEEGAAGAPTAISA